MATRKDKAPGLVWRMRKNRRVAYWIARASLVKQGFEPQTVPVWTGGEPTPADLLLIKSACMRHQQQMELWASGRAPPFDGKLSTLISIYQRDPDSPYRGLRPHSRRTYDYDCTVLTRHVGERQLKTITGRDLLHWYAEFRKPKKDGGPERVRRAHGLMTMLRIVLQFGVVIEVDSANCARLSMALSKTRFEVPKARTSALTADMAIAIRQEARAAGHPAIALAQALQFELTLRQKDVIGEWIRLSEPGLSAVTERGDKWVGGLRWDEIEGDRLFHTTSKTGQIAEFNLSLYPMIVEELALIPNDQRTGPMIVCKRTGLPYRTRRFCIAWRKIATKAGVPSTVFNMDSRAGGVTEATDAGADMEAVRHHAQHSNASTTARYSRTTLEKTSGVARKRSAFRETK